MRAAGEKLETAYPPQRASAAQMRRALRAYLSELALDTNVVYDVVLAAEEAFINAVSHAEAADDLIRVTARVSASEASIEVRDGGGGIHLSQVRHRRRYLTCAAPEAAESSSWRA